MSSRSDNLKQLLEAGDRLLTIIGRLEAHRMIPSRTTVHGGEHGTINLFSDIHSTSPSPRKAPKSTKRKRPGP